jgi:hypothetical protein
LNKCDSLPGEIRKALNCPQKQRQKSNGYLKVFDRATRVTHLVPALLGGGGIIGGAERYAFEFRYIARVKPPMAHDRLDGAGHL